MYSSSVNKEKKQVPKNKGKKNVHHSCSVNNNSGSTNQQNYYSPNSQNIPIKQASVSRDNQSNLNNVADIKADLNKERIKH